MPSLPPAPAAQPGASRVALCPSPFKLLGSTVLFRFTSGLTMQTMAADPMLDLELVVRDDSKTAKARWSKKEGIRQFAK